MSAELLEDHLLAPRGLGSLPGPGHAGRAGGAPCGDLVRVEVRVEGDRVADAAFEASGCGAARAAGSAVVELTSGRPLLEVARVGATEVAQALGGLSAGKHHAASLAAEALHRALGAAAADGAPRLAPSSHRTLVAMSGGVDSALAAHVALDRGDEVVAVTLELWADPANDGTRSCCSPQAVGGARALAHRMGLAHFTLDLREQFRREVVEDFVAEYQAGRTPNPCVRCNGLVRFDEMLALAGRLGAARLATGHYARVEGDGEGPLLAAAADPDKDQTYMLARIAPEALGRLWFPLAELTKPEVRDRARVAGLDVADKVESQDLCFLAGVDRASFLRRHAPAPDAAEPGEALPLAGPDGRRGEVLDLEGRLLGHHDGHAAFTVGQRRGLGLAGPAPLYVIEKDAAANRVVVGPKAALAADRVEIADARLHRPAERVDRVKLRYRSRPVGCRVEDEVGPGRHARLRLRLDEAVDSVAPGQTACLLQGEKVVGSATIRGR
jgi:tRNA-specific 2-thiouridylase